MMAERLYATTTHYRGDQVAADRVMSRMLARAACMGRQPRVARFQIDQTVTANYFHARILWLLGRCDRARAVVERDIEEGLALGHALSFAACAGKAVAPSRCSPATSRPRAGSGPCC
jgi:hypothetical protein